jgi:hypothetical protein
VTPLAAVGVLAAHAAAYALTGVDPGPLHEYVDHATQILVVVASFGIVGLACQQRSLGTPSSVPFGLLALVGFTCQEHLERLAHTGEIPWLLTSPTFLVGLVLQLPVALVSLLLARRIVCVLDVRPRRRRRGGDGAAWLPLPLTPVPTWHGHRPLRACGRAPPVVLAS